MIKFKVGDYVVIKKGLNSGIQRNNLYVNDLMVLLGGIKFKISFINLNARDGKYRGITYYLENSPWTWTEDLFEGYKKVIKEFPIVEFMRAKV